MAHATHDSHTTHVRETSHPDNDEEVTRTTTSAPDEAPGTVVAARITYWIGGAIMSLLALRFILALLGANRANPFADFIFTLSYPFAAPFFGLFNYEPSYGVATLEVGTLVAIIVFAILTAGIAKLFTIGSRTRDDEV